MSREIKFRGLSKDTNEWVYGYYVKRAFKHWIEVLIAPSPAPDEYGLSTGFSVEVIPESVGQWTGLVDKESVEIFEGDTIEFDAICERHYKDSKVIEEKIQRQKFPVEFENGGFGVYFAGWRDLPCLTNIEILGNIHSELLKSK